MREQVDIMDEAAWAVFVSDAEDAMSRETPSDLPGVATPASGTAGRAVTAIA